MERPLWVLIVGLIMLLFGGCGGISNDLKQINSKVLIELQSDFMQEINKEVKNEKLDSNELKVMKFLVHDTIAEKMDENLSGSELSAIINSMSHMSPEAQDKLARHGYMGIPISILFFIFSLFLILKRNPLIPKLCIGLLIISMLFAAFQIYDLRDADMAHVFKAGQKFALGMGASLDAILLIILGLFKSDDYFTPNAGQESYQLTHRDN